MKKVTFTQNNQHQNLFEGDIELDIENAVNMNLQAITIQASEKPKLFLKEGQDFPVVGNVALRFTPNQKVRWYFWAINGEVNISDQLCIPLETSVPDSPVLYYNNFENLDNLNVVDSDKVSITAGSEGLVFTDLQDSPNVPMSKIDTIGHFEFDATQGMFICSFDLKRDQTDTSFLLLIRDKDNPGGDFIGFQSNKPEHAGVRLYSKKAGVIEDSQITNIESAEGFFHIEISSSGEVNLFKAEVEDVIGQVTFNPANMFLQIARNGSAEAGKKTSVAFVQITEV